MTNYLKFSLLLIAILPAYFAQAQTLQDDYLKGKEYFNNEEYTFALEYFKKVAKEKGPLQPYASFYFGLSAYKNDQSGLARSMWMQIEKKHPKWDKINEVRYWLAKVYFDEGSYDKGLLYAKQLHTDVTRSLTYELINSLDSLPQLRTLYVQFPEESQIGQALADSIITLPVSQRNFQELYQIVQKFDLDREKYGLPEIGESQMKDEYKVAVLFPFFFDGMETAMRTARNKTIMDLYFGLKEAVDDLNAEAGARITLFPYDTKRNVDTTAAILARDELKGMDLIVGPLFPEPAQIAMDFSYEQKINVINPLSSNSDLIQYNPYSFIFRPTIETQALVAAGIARDSVKNKYAMVFYEDNPRDSLNAYTYAQRIQEYGFELLINRAVVDTTVREAFDMLTEKYEEVYTEDQVDSVLAIDENRIIKERKSIEEKDVIEYYEEFFTIAPDSIGHIYVASSRPLYASNFISAVEIRNDSTRIIGHGSWKNFETVTYEELERLGIFLIDPDFIDIHDYAFRDFRKRYVSRYHYVPVFNTLLCYEMMTYCGRMLKEYGTYFQNGTSEKGFSGGVLFQGTDFTFSNSNQYVPVTQFIKSKSEVINPRK